MNRSFTGFIVLLPLLGIAAWGDEFRSSIRPLLATYCFDCHSTDTQKGELDLERFHDLKTIRGDLRVWQQVVYQLENNEMPPPKNAPPTAEEKQRLLHWVKNILRAEALANAGDPGPLVLRRLSNAEYTYTMRDLTGVATLDPLTEFPADSAAGEGFANAGAAMVMSPALFAKYLEAAKGIAKHAVLLPDGIAWSAHTTERDWTDERLVAIRAFYRHFTADGSMRLIERPGIRLNMVEGGAIPLERHLRATVEARARLQSTDAFAEVANERDLSPKYLRTMWNALNDTSPSFLLDPIRRQWRSAKPDVDAIADQIRDWQGVLWRFASIGHIGKVNGPKAWQIPVLPLAASQEIVLPLPKSKVENLSLYLITGDAGDGNTNDLAVWDNARVEFEKRPPIPLLQLEKIQDRIKDLRRRELSRTSRYLDAIARAYAAKAEPATFVGDLNPRLLSHWANYTRLDRSPFARPTGHFKGKQGEMSGYPDLKTLGSPRTPSLVVNQGDNPIRIATRTYPARGVAIHPSPTVEAVIFWQSPIAGRIKVSGQINDADAGCGNGVTWRVEILGRHGHRSIGEGRIDRGRRQSFSSKNSILVQPGDLLRVSVNPRDKNHVCDTTEVKLTIRESEGERAWDLATDIVDRIHDSNPLPDSFGNAAVWHFCGLAAGNQTPSKRPADSALAVWIDAVVAGESVQELRRLGRKVNPRSVPALTDSRGPLDWLGLAISGISLDQSSTIETTGGEVKQLILNGRLVAGGTFKATARLHPEKGREGSVQMRAQLNEPAKVRGAVAGNLQVRKGRRLWSDGVEPISADSIIIVNQGSKAHERVLAAVREHRALFPAALCYSKIVPVDEVVTLTLFHREDEWLRRLFLDKEQTAEIDRLWSELRFVSRDALKLVDVYEQLWQFATQDAKPTAFDPLRKPIMENAKVFREQQRATEPKHVDAVLKFAARAWRRPLSEQDETELRGLYAQLRKDGMQHDESIRLVLARVLVAPDYLYKSERPTEETGPVTGSELATRLSYFLWSTTPDDELLRIANRLDEGDVLRMQTQRLLRSERIRRLALEFGCQWLGIRDFDQLDEKNENLYPDFESLRIPMREEAIRFFTDLFQNNRSILSLLNADHTYVNQRLAKFYGIAFPGNETLTSSATTWRRVRHDRGGILGMAATLARHSGASRTSPILRGNWVYETLLGKHLPNPPADVPQLPEALPDGLTERELIERHSSAPACAKCHERIDPHGFALEGFDAIGRTRKAADTRAQLPDGREINGLKGLRTYLLNDRRDEFVRQFCRKLLGFALGRSSRLSDEPLLDEMLKQLEVDEYRVHTIIEMIVHSRQFREIRGQEP